MTDAAMPSPIKNRISNNYIASQYLKIQKSNQRLQRLLKKFTNDPENRLHSVHESIVCQNSVIREENQKRESEFKSNFSKKSRKLLEHKNKDSSKQINMVRSLCKSKKSKELPPVNGKEKPKNFLQVNKLNVFDPHCLAQWKREVAQNSKRKKIT